MGFASYSNGINKDGTPKNIAQYWPKSWENINDKVDKKGWWHPPKTDDKISNYVCNLSEESIKRGENFDRGGECAFLTHCNQGLLIGSMVNIASLKNKNIDIDNTIDPIEIAIKAYNNCKKILKER